MVAIPRGKEIVACGHAGSRRAVIAVAPAAEPVPTDRIIKSLELTVSGAARSHVTARAARAVDQARVNVLRGGRNPVAHGWGR